MTEHHKLSRREAVTIMGASALLPILLGKQREGFAAERKDASREGVRVKSRILNMSLFNRRGNSKE
jgi:hypothetical protein